MGRLRNDRDIVQHIPRDLADLATRIVSLRGKANIWPHDASYVVLRHRLGAAHTQVETATIEARRRVRLNKEKVEP